MAVIAGAIAVGVATLAVVAYTAVARSLRSSVERQALRDTELVVSQLGPARLPASPSAPDLVSGGLRADLERTTAGYLVRFDDGSEVASGFAYGGRPPAEIVDLVASDRYALQWTDIANGRRQVLVGARQQPAGPTFFLYYDAESTEAALTSLSKWLALGAVAVVVLGTGAAFVVSGRLLRPVARVADAARGVAAGDLSSSVPVQSDDELGDLAASFNHMTHALADKIAELQAAEAAQRGFVADVSHELRTPITALVHEADLLRDVLGDRPDTARLVDLLVGDVHRLRTLVQDLLEVSRLDAAAEEIRVEPVDLSRFLAHVVAARSPAAVISIGPDAPVLYTDPRRLERIVGNLLDNANRHGGGNVTVAVQPDGTTRRCRVIVADRGEGIAPGDEERIFERFVKRDASRHGEGTGLGLAIARSHARALGGELVARHRDGGGALFVLELPIDGVARSLHDGEGVATVDPEGVNEPLLTRPEYRP